jgi:2,3-bisphosphoglycerate-dependent phosphoglycerate mutase
MVRRCIDTTDFIAIRLPLQVYTVVLIRHGESQWNIENRFTGWVDVPLAATGVAESHRAAAELKKENFEFDIVYTSCLKRAIKTAWNILEDLDQM